MANISHPSMKPVKEARNTAPAPKNYVVENAASTTPVQDVDDRLAQFEAANIPYVAPVVVKPMSKDLEKLIFVGRLTSEVEIDGVKFELATISNKEYKQIAKKMYGFSEPADLLTARNLTLANAIRKIDGKSIDDIDIGEVFEDSFDKRLALIEMLQLAVVTKLYDEYEALSKTKQKVEEKAIEKSPEEIKNL